MRTNHMKSASMTICGTIALATTPVLAGGCPTDLNGDDATGFSDLTAMLNAWGPCAACPEDIDGDGSVGFSDLTQLLNGWGPCPIDVFEYPAYYQDMFVAAVGLQLLGPTGPLVLPEPQYDRIARDIDLMRAARPEIDGSQQFHTWRWEPFGSLLTYDKAVPRDELDAAVAYYQGVVVDEYFGGLILFIDFPMGANPWAMVPILEAVPGVITAEVNGYAGTSAITPRWEPTDVGGGALLWKVVVPWCDGGLCLSGPLDCVTTYEFFITADGTLSILDITNTPWQGVGDCGPYPPNS